MRRRVYFKVDFILPEGATLDDAEAYVNDAVRTMKGCYRPPDDEDDGDPMSGLDADTVRIVRVR